MKKIVTYVVAIALLAVASCSEDFTTRESLDGASLDNYYNSADEVRAGTSTLYSGLPWHGFLSRGMDNIGDLMSGNMYAGASDYAPYRDFTLTSTAVYVQYSWTAFYKVAGWAGSMLKALEMKKTLGGDASFLDPAIAECHFMRGTVYFYIARTWGAAPIIEDPGKTAIDGNYNIPRYIESDVFKFAENELLLAEEGLPETDVPGRVTKYTAKAMLAKLYLYLADVNDDATLYSQAAAKALEVMNSAYYDLVPANQYQTMFNSSSMNNNIESIFAVQHQLAQNPWGTGNQLQCDRGPGNLSTSESNMWGSYIPSLDYIASFEPGDNRRKATIMEQGWSMPNWKPKTNDADYNAFMANGYVYDTIAPDQKGGIKTETRASIAKYIVGPGAAFGGESVIGMNTGQNFMVLRYADVLLIYAEAMLGTNASTSEGTAVEAYNKIRRRALLPEKATITKDDIMQERHIEFAFEGDYWFDIKRQGFAKAKQIIESQNRGTVYTANYVTFTESCMYLPIPLTEITQDPELTKDPVPYYTK